MYMTSLEKVNYFIEKAEKNGDEESRDRWVMAKCLVMDTYEFFDQVSAEEDKSMRTELINAIRQAYDECVINY